jgi:probable HAF family extracellular repeat protein
MNMQAFRGLVLHLARLTASAVFIALTIPVPVVAQHHHYKLIDIGTLGGPIGYGSVNGDGFRLLNNSGAITGTADTPFPDPNAAYGCYDLDCYQGHAYVWKDGVMTDLGTLPGNSNSAGGSINSHGWITGQSQSSVIDPNLGVPELRPVLWGHNRITDLGTLPGGTEAIGIFVNDSDQVVGFSDNGIPDPFSLFFTGTQIHTFIWQKGTMQDIGTLGGPDTIPGADCAVAPPNQVVGASYTSSSPNAWTGIPTLDPFLWNHGVMTDLGTLGGTIGFAQCVNHQGQIIGNSDLSGDLNTHAFLWQDGAMGDLGTLGGDNSTALWLNEAGAVAGYADLPGSQAHHPVIWKSGKIVDLGTVENDPCGQALSLNARGQVVGGTSDCSYFLHAFLSEPGGPMLDLNTLIPDGSGLQLTFALDINDRGEILAKALPRGGNPYQDADLYGHLVLLVPCDLEVKEGCEASLGPASADFPLAPSSASGKPIPSWNLRLRHARETTSFHRRFGVSLPR